MLLAVGSLGMAGIGVLLACRGRAARGAELLRAVTAHPQIRATGRLTGFEDWGRMLGRFAGRALRARAERRQLEVRRRLGIATAAAAALAGVALVTSRPRARAPREGSSLVRATLAVNRPPSALYDLWRDLEGTPRFLRHIASVTLLDGGRTQWMATGPGNLRAEWTAHVVEDVAGSHIAWETQADSDVVHDGVVRFTPAPDGRGSLVDVQIEHHPRTTIQRLLPRGAFRLAQAELREDLRRFKRLAETGEIPTTREQPSGRSPSRRGEPR
jgi:uncharacterized membrane protein